MPTSTPESQTAPQSSANRGLGHFITTCYRLFSKDLTHHPSTDTTDLSMDALHILKKWRKLIFKGLFSGLLIFAAIPYGLSVYHAIQHELWINLAMYTVSYTLVFLIVVLEPISFRVKAVTGIAILYALGLVALLFAETGGSGTVYLMSISIMATVLVGTRLGMVTLLTNALTLIGVGYLVANDSLAWVHGDPLAFRVYLLKGTTFLFLNSTITISVAFLVRSLESHFIQAQTQAHTLQQVNDQLMENQARQKKLESQLIQAQKMESVGRLAGGVAHDFNNMLTVIKGHSELSMFAISRANPVYKDLKEIHEAAGRAEDLTRQLLAFARKQTIAPRPLDLNATVESMLRMLGRLMGEQIELAWHPEPHLPAVNMDPSQLDQVLANLCVNARDAISGVGQVTIESARVTLDPAYCHSHAEFVPGDYVVLSVTDTGCGMDPRTTDQMFDPFFTTKSMGEGTGLGLSTVYGIVKQNQGIIQVKSEPGHGTCLRIYLPSAAADSPVNTPTTPVTIAPGRGETILLVEDEDAIMRVGSTMLERLGYRVMAVGTPAKAIALAKAHKGPIHLLITDVVMPQMNGRELALTLQEMDPRLKVLYMSGYTANVIANHGMLEEGIHFMPKPFSLTEMANAVSEALAVETPQV